MRVADLVDPWLYRHPFEGRSARRYAEIERVGFGDLDARLVESWKRDLGAARRLIDVGAGPATFERALAERFPRLAVHGVEPSRAFARTDGACPMVRGRGEALPFRDGAFELGLCLSSIRHVTDRAATLAELRRVVTRAAWIVELDPRSSRDRVHNHTRPMRSPILRWAFGPLVVATAPRAEDIASVAEAAGWRVVEVRPDPLQPVYVMRLE